MQFVSLEYSLHEVKPYFLGKIFTQAVLKIKLDVQGAAHSDSEDPEWYANRQDAILSWPYDLQRPHAYPNYSKYSDILTPCHECPKS